MLTASVVGFLFGGMIGSRHAGDKYIAINHHSKFTSTMQAQVHKTACVVRYYNIINNNIIIIIILSIIIERIA